MSKRCLVTGGSGFIGSHLVEQLLGRGHRVTVIDNYSTGRPLNLAHLKQHPELRVEQADINDAARVAPLFEGIDWVFHLAALADIVPSIQMPDALLSRQRRRHLRGARGGARRTACKRFLYAASSSCYGIPDHLSDAGDGRAPPAISLRADQVARRAAGAALGAGLRAAGRVAALFNVYGPRARTRGTYGAVFGVFLAQKLSPASR